MGKTATIPNHGATLTSKDGTATEALQLYLDAISIYMNADRSPLPSHTVSGAPSPLSGYGMIMVTDEAGGAVPAFSDLTNWRRVTDRAVIS
jgi:hypothetical protein